jgi:hypothetical protein
MVAQGVEGARNLVSPGSLNPIQATLGTMYLAEHFSVLLNASMNHPHPPIPMPHSPNCDRLLGLSRRQLLGYGALSLATSIVTGCSNHSTFTVSSSLGQAAGKLDKVTLEWWKKRALGL